MNNASIAPYIPENAPFSKEQIGWLNGFLAGMYSTASSVGSTDASLSEESAKTVTLLWGSQTGNTETLSKQAAKSLKNNGFAPRVIDFADYNKSSLVDEELLLIMTSTYGDGDPPDNAMDFYEWLHSDEAPKLDKTRYSVLSLGDSNYPDFCKCGIDLDNRLKVLGGTEICPRMDCDVDFEEPFTKWIHAVGQSLKTSESVDSEGSLDTEVAAIEKPIAYGKANPFPSNIIANRNLNGDGSAKETRHVELSIATSGFEYEAGDALAVVPENCSLYVGDLLNAVGFSGQEFVNSPNGEKGCLRDALTRYHDIANLSPKVAKAYAAIALNEELNTLVEDRDRFKEYSWGRQFIDLLLRFPTTFESPDEFVSILPKLAPRLYSISSSPNAHPNQVHITAGVVRYETHGRDRKGVCSSYLGEHEGAAPVSVFFHHTKSFKLPSDNDAPVIMIGPGTGIAPFRAFLEERNARGANGKNWLFFGDQHASLDFLYKEEIESYFASGLLTRFDTAFSRDQAEKIYVQDRMREHGKELFEWLDQGAYFYVCGDASRMAKDVDQALVDIVEKHSSRDHEDAVEYIKNLKSEKRYLRDVY